MANWHDRKIPQKKVKEKKANATPPSQPYHRDVAEWRRLLLQDVVIVVIVVIIVAGVVSVGVDVVRRRRLKRRQNEAEGTPTRRSTALKTASQYISEGVLYRDPEKLVMVHNEIYGHTEGRRNVDILETRYVPRDDIVHVRDLGEGAFGVVFLGRVSAEHWRRWGVAKDRGDDEESANGIDDEEVYVAVKTLKGENVQSSFEREARMMSNFNHGNIVQLYGICTDVDPFLMVFEYMDQGDLKSFLRRHSTKGLYQISGDSESSRVDTPLLLGCVTRNDARQSGHKKDSESKTTAGNSCGAAGASGITTQELIDICCQIAEALSFLADRKFIHRDVATRNCLVDSRKNVKLGDFGMSRNIHSGDYYKIQVNDLLPVRWMPPESLLYRRFSLASDVWSFGVTVWEIFAYGARPWDWRTNEEVLNLVCEGNQLTPPDSCPKSINYMLRRCWAMEPSKRPRVGRLLLELKAALKQVKRNPVAVDYVTAADVFEAACGARVLGIESGSGGNDHVEYNVFENKDPKTIENHMEENAREGFETVIESGFGLDYEIDIFRHKNNHPGCGGPLTTEAAESLKEF